MSDTQGTAVAGAPEQLDVDVAGGRLRVARWGSGPVPVLGIHGITASSVSLLPVARRLAGRHTVLAPDLRGRGASSELPGPYGMQAHAADCARVLEDLAGGPAFVVGESMGGFVAVVLAAARPELVAGVVLVDGGIPLPLPAGVDGEALAAAVLGPALSRLEMTFPSVDAYLEFWRAHPAVGEEWNADVEAYLRYDLVPTTGGYRSRVSAEAVRADSLQTLAEPEVVGDALGALRCPVHLLRATRNLLNQPPGLIPDEVVAGWRGRVPLLSDEVVDDTNHYTLMLGERGANVIAARTAGMAAG